MKKRILKRAACITLAVIMCFGGGIVSAPKAEALVGVDDALFYLILALLVGSGITFTSTDAMTQVASEMTDGVKANAPPDVLEDLLSTPSLGALKDKAFLWLLSYMYNVQYSEADKALSVPIDQEFDRPFEITKEVLDAGEGKARYFDDALSGLVHLYRGGSSFYRSYNDSPFVYTFQRAKIEAMSVDERREFWSKAVGGGMDIRNEFDWNTGYFTLRCYDYFGHWNLHEVGKWSSIVVINDVKRHFIGTDGRCFVLSSDGTFTNSGQVTTWEEYRQSQMNEGRPGFTWQGEIPYNVDKGAFENLPNVIDEDGKVYVKVPGSVNEAMGMTPGDVFPEAPAVPVTPPVTAPVSLQDLIALARSIAKDEDLIGDDWENLKKGCDDLARLLGWFADNWADINTLGRVGAQSVFDDLTGTLPKVKAGDGSIVREREIAEAIKELERIKAETEAGTAVKEGINWEPLKKFGGALASLFPFCLPFDMIRMVESFGAVPEAPKFEFVVVSKGSFPGLKEDAKVVLDLAVLDPVMPIMRFMILAVFVVGLIKVSSGLIKW